MARKSLKSPEERIAEAQALIARLEAEAAQADIASDPKLTPIRELSESLKSERLVLMRGFANHAQNFENRRMAHQLWIDEIDLCEQRDRVHIATIEGVLQQIVADADALAGMTDDEVRGYVSDLEREIRAECQPSRTEAHAARHQREAFNAQRKAPKRKPKEDAAEA
jgi:hypothetical protein